MEALARFHPWIIHTPIALITVGFLFELVGRATDLGWWREAAFAMLIVGVLGAGAAVLSGEQAGELAEKQGVPEAPVDEHEEAGKLTLWLGIAAVVLRAVASRTGRARAVVSGLALALFLATAVAVGVAGFRGGHLVYEHGAAVRVNGTPVVQPRSESGGAGKGEPGEHVHEHEGR